jgi:hypothetical protein
MIKKWNNKKNCGRKPMQWIDKKGQILITIPNSVINELAPESVSQDKKYLFVGKLLSDNIQAIKSQLK